MIVTDTIFFSYRAEKQSALGIRYCMLDTLQAVFFMYYYIKKLLTAQMYHKLEIY